MFAHRPGHRMHQLAFGRDQEESFLDLIRCADAFHLVVLAHLRHAQGRSGEDARAGLAAFTKVFADTYAADNVRMNNVLPGWIDSLPATEERRESVPMKRYGRSEEIAATIGFLVSPGAGYITGQNIRVD